MTDGFQWFVPRRFALVAGQGTAHRVLNAFDTALRDAGVGDMNLLQVSSILPPQCVRIEAPLPLQPGALLPIAYASMDSDDPAVTAVAAVSVGVPVDASLPGVIMEFHGHGSEEDALQLVKEMAQEAMDLRGTAIKEILTISASSRPDSFTVFGCAFAGVALMP